MANNFRDILGFSATNYVAKSPAGNDSNDGLTKDTPKASFGSTNSSIFVQIGAGMYTGGPINLWRAIGDGEVIIDFEGNTIQSESFYDWQNLTIKNAILNSTTNPLDSTICNNLKLYNCQITHGIGVSSARQRRFAKSIFTDGFYRATNVGSIYFDQCIFINHVSGHTGSSISRHTSCYVDSDSIIYCPNFTDLGWCNVNGLVAISQIMFGDSLERKYAIQDNLTGTPQDNGYDIGVNWLSEAQLTSDGYTGTVTGWDGRVATCINRLPKFNNDSIEDYSLQSDSPHIGNGSTGVNIGGTEVRTSILVTDNGIGDIEIIPSSEIDTSLINSFRLLDGETEGYVDFIYKRANVATTIGIIDILAALNFNTDFIGGTPQNSDVPDSEPLTLDYPDKLTTTSLASDAFTLNITAHGRSIGEFFRVLGQDREIIAVTTDTITTDVALRAPVGSGVLVQIGTEVQLGALRPNRLTFLFRSSKQSAKPTLDNQWDNDIDPVYGFAGEFLTIENGSQPSYYIDVDDSIYGGGDSSLPPGLSQNFISGIWRNVRVYIRDNYGS